MKRINNNAPVTCSKSICINAKIENVWNVITGINQWTEWQTRISKSRLNGTLEVNSTFDWKTGGVKIHSTLHTVEFPRHFGWTGKTFGMFAIHNWNLDEREGQTIVTVDESMEGFLAQVFKKSFNRNLEQDMLLWLQLLKQECEKK